MINIINNEKIKGLVLFNILRICVTKDKGLLINSYAIMIKLFKYEVALVVGKEVRNGKKTKQKLKESKNTYASA